MLIGNTCGLHSRFNHRVSLNVIVLLLLLSLYFVTAETTDIELQKAHPACKDTRKALDKCQFVRDFCQNDHLGYFNYLQFYYCSENFDTWAKLIIIISWLGLLFMTIGIAASDYLCPNLNTISKMLGLPESLAGVTFLAFGNGSPDVFSTYAAMRVGSASLAIGELIGAASFVTAVVIGSMAIIRPFKVSRRPFLRDLSFFIISIIFSMYFVSDGVLKMWECSMMFGIYAIYVLFISTWHYYNTRTKPEVEERTETNTELEYGSPLPTTNNNQGFLEVAPREDSPALTPISRSSTPLSALSALSAPAWNDQTEEEQEAACNELNRIMQLHRLHQRNPHYKIDSNVSSASPRRRSGSHSPIYPIRNSIVGALEMGNVLQQYTKNDTASVHSPSSAVRSPGVTPYNSPIKSPFSSSSTGKSYPVLQSEDGHLAIPPLFPPSSSSVKHNRDIPKLIVSDLHADQENISFSGNIFGHYSSLQSPASVSPNELSSPLLPVPHTLVNETQSNNSWEFLKEIFTTLCPPFIDFETKPFFYRVLCLLTAPLVLLLTVTVPVIESEAIIKDSEDGQFEEVASALDEDVSSDEIYIPLIKWLLIVQAIFGPLFILFNWFLDNMDAALLLVCSLLVTTFIIAGLSFLRIEQYKAPLYMQKLAFAGFIVAISWVALIANEVVGILKALGVIFNISDAVMGLTVFAIGNSLGDLISNTAITKMGFPMMALSACFGGPMLNILVGVGFSGLVVMSSNSGDGYHIKISHTLIISGGMLLITLLFWLISVPLNGWKLTRPLGIAAIVFWVFGTFINVIFQIK